MHPVTHGEEKNNKVALCGIEPLDLPHSAMFSFLIFNRPTDMRLIIKLLSRSYIKWLVKSLVLDRDCACRRHGTVL